MPKRSPYSRDGVHADVLGDAHGHQVARLLEAGADRRRAVVGVARVLRRPDAGAGRHLDRRVEHDGRRAVAVVERGGIDEGLERRARLAQRLGRAVEDARLVGEAALHREDPAGLGVHRHEAALDRRDLAVGPAVDAPSSSTALTKITSPTSQRSSGPSAARSRPFSARTRAQLASSKLRKWPSSSSATPSMPIRAEPSPIDRITAGCQPSMSRGTWAAADSARRQLASSAGSKPAGSIWATGPR